MDYKDQIRHFIVANFLFQENAELEDSASFLETGIIDSTGILELVTFLEETFEITVEDDELIPENLDTLTNVVDYVERKLDSNEPPVRVGYAA